MPVSTLLIAGLSALLAGPAPAPAAPPATPATAEEIVEFVDNRVFSQSMSYHIRMTSYRDGRAHRQYGMQVYKRGPMLRIDFQDPAVERGRRVLNDGRDLWMFLARTSRTIRLANRQSFMGTDASNQDLLRISLGRDYQIDGAAQPRTVDGRALTLVRLRARDPATSYDRIDLYVDAASRVPVMQEFLTVSGRAVKRVRFDRVGDVGGAPFPARVTIENLLVRGAQTVLEYDRVDRAPSQTAAFFTLAALRR